LQTPALPLGYVAVGNIVADCTFLVKKGTIWGIVEMASITERLRRCAECGTSFVDTAGSDFCPPCLLLLPAAGRQRGVVKWYNRTKGYGFITPIQGAELFFHKSALGETTTLRTGQLVEFAVTSGTRGVQASDVLPLAIDE
jgi:CspA family cold shock protein